jgi:hypothetical protein
MAVEKEWKLKVNTTYEHGYDLETWRSVLWYTPLVLESDRRAVLAMRD